MKSNTKTNLNRLIENQKEYLSGKNFSDQDKQSFIEYIYPLEETDLYEVIAKSYGEFLNNEQFCVVKKYDLNAKFHPGWYGFEVIKNRSDTRSNFKKLLIEEEVRRLEIASGKLKQLNKKIEFHVPFAYCMLHPWYYTTYIVGKLWRVYEQ